MTTIPDFMPVLSRGAHEGPSDGACIMEYASFITGDRWTDFPGCTNRVLAKAAQLVNDLTEDDERQQLLPLLPRLMGTTEDTSEIRRAMAVAALDWAERCRARGPRYAEFLGEAIHEFSSGQWEWAVREAIYTVSDATHGDLVAMLTAIIDAYDKATGRTEAASVTEDDLRRCAELTAAQ
jgi:hypothetical protein